MAVLDACEQILARLRPIREKLPSDAKWADVVTTAFFERINLTAQGFYIIHTDRCGFDWDAPHHVSYPGPTTEFYPFNYFTQGVAVVEAEIDCLTGNHSIPRADILMDVGKSINPVLDIGQIEGAFIQGCEGIDILFCLKIHVPNNGDYSVRDMLLLSIMPFQQ